MKATEDILAIPDELRTALREALEKLALGIRDPQAAKKACERMDRMREENRRLFGEHNNAVEIIREMRNSQ
jgi:hypothetical protein